jgi:tetratricopeptide (TPR) repeat protein
MGMLLAKTFLFNKRYSDAAAILDKIVVIPYEGATDGRRLYKEAHLMLAVKAMHNKKYKKAVDEITIARQWPERLGVGKPYTEDIDERLEQFLLYQCFTQLQDKTKAAAALEQIKQNKATLYAGNNAISAWAAGNAAALENLPGPAATDDTGRVLAEWLKIR